MYSVHSTNTLENSKHRGTNNHRKDTKKMKSIPYDEHFRLTGHDFTKHAKFIIIEALDKTTETMTDRKILKECEDYWISPNGFNDQFNRNIRNKI